ncbi:ATP-dependent protease ATPase subunit HslU [Devosia sp.]|jgi:ATP-dependent HslUV protease ATP-binding subunit HslU|uniref:ATP-dependent protease ATPase subunit HslU n=1 Tax=Devosia sp. TaxID=1871048 RepID=UPI0019E9B729|nr:ATP-dependent protease ATPase subunit HslU [Devosia sp.]MBE0580314.1 ATP-dependent protease ATPase subunit HslU [Devosia sp.]
MSETNFSPREIVSELDRNIVGQHDAKRAVAVALRNRWRRQQLSPELRREITPKNILMIGPTGVGKTEISRRLARLAQAPFIKVEATKFTEVGYVGRDVEQIIRDLVEAGIAVLRDKRRADVQAQAHANAENRVLDALVGNSAAPSTRDSFRKKLRANELDDSEIEIEMQPAPNTGGFEIPGMPNGGIGMINLSDMFKSAMGGRGVKRKIKVKDAYEPLIAEEADKLLDQDQLKSEAIELVENHGIVFIDEIDKVAHREGGVSGGPSREGVQRDLLPLIEGTTVSTKYGPVSTDHILFIASGAFHVSKPSDLLPELQGRLPIRVELKALTREDFIRILSDTDNSLIKQYVALMGTEGVTLDFTKDAIEAIADAAVKVNNSVENIGARRLQTVMERLVEDISFEAPDKQGQTITIDAAFVAEKVGVLAADQDLSKFVL